MTIRDGLWREMRHKAGEAEMDEWHEAYAMVDGKEERIATAPDQAGATRAGLHAAACPPWIHRGITELVIYRCVPERSADRWREFRSHATTTSQPSAISTRLARSSSRTF